MGRPKGSLNKPKSCGGTFLLNFEKHIEGAPIVKKNPLGWVNWGARNNYPNLLLNLYNESVTHRSCINFGVMSIIGNGVDYQAMNVDGSQILPNSMQSWDDIVRSISLDYMLYGSYAVQVIKNKGGETYSFYHMPLDKVRWGAYNENGDIESYYISNDWTARGANPPQEIAAFDFSSEIEIGKPYLYVYRQYTPTLEYYTAPNYQGGIKAIQTEIEHLNYDLKTTVNGFTPSGMLVLNEVDSEATRADLINKVTTMFQGSENANAVMITFRGNVEEKDPTFIPFAANATKVNLYDAANGRTVNRILAAHQIPNASLVGMPDMVGSGFASEADKLKVAYELYNKVVGNYNRMAVIKTLNHMLAMNGVDAEIIMKPLSFNDFGDDADVSERTEVAKDINKEKKEEGDDNA